jgi:YVTN family beta-propeller protein
MRPLRISLQLLLLLCVVLRVAQAKIPYAYVANSGSNNVTVINTATGAVVGAPITVGTTPSGVAINQASTLVYVANFGSNNVSVISTATNTVTSTFNVQTNPAGVAFTPTGATVYVTNNGSGSVSVVNPKTTPPTVTKTIPVQTNPLGVAVTPNGAYVYVVNNGSGSVSVISTLTNTVVTTISVGASPTWVAISPDGSSAYVTNSSSNTVSVIQTANNTIVNTINVSAGPAGAAVSPDGHWLYVANYNGGAGNLVTIIDTGTQTVAKTVTVGTGPVGVAFTQDSKSAGVVNKGSNNVSVIDTASQTVGGTPIAVGTDPDGGAVLGPKKVSTVVGGVYLGDHGPATNAAIATAASQITDNAGNLYISDVTGNRIRKVATTGVITTYAGNGICGYNGDGMAATKAMLCAPTGLTLDSAGNLIVAEQGNNRVRKISKGKISTIAGNGVFGNSGDGGPATSAAIGEPWWAAYDAAGNLYISEIYQCVIRKVSTSGTITTVAGNGTCGYSGDGGPATAAQMQPPRGLAFDANGNLYIADRDNSLVRKVDTSGTITTFAGNNTSMFLGKGGFTGDGGPAFGARIGFPRTVAVRNGVLYISNAGHARFRMVDLTTNTINSYAGSSGGYDGDGHALLASQFQGVTSISFDSAGNPLFGDAQNGRQRKGSGGIVNTIAGGYLGDGGKATAAALVLPEAVAIDKSGNFYIADYTGNRVRKVSAGVIHTIAGTGITGYTGDGGPGTSATLNRPDGVAVDSSGNVFIADEVNGVIREVNTAGAISTFASNINFNDLYQMAIDAGNNLYVTDDFACVIWKITPAALVTIAAGVLNTCGYNGDSIAATSAQLNTPYAVAVDSGGNLYIADYLNNRIREVISSSGVIVTIAGNGTCGYTGDGGPATSGELCPNGIVVDSKGVVYVVDNFTRIRQIKSNTITTFAGAGFGFNGDGLWPLYTDLSEPVAVAVDSKGAVYVLDDWDHRLRKIQ